MKDKQQALFLRSTFKALLAGGITDKTEASRLLSSNGEQSITLYLPTPEGNVRVTGAHLESRTITREQHLLETKGKKIRQVTPDSSAWVTSDGT